MNKEPEFTIRASDPGAAKALRTIASNVRVTDPARAVEIEKQANAMDAWARQPRPGAGFIPSR